MKLVFQRVNPWGTPWGTARTKATIDLGDIRRVKPRFWSIENYGTVQGQDKLLGFGQKFHIRDVATEKAEVKVPGVWSKLEAYINKNREPSL
jgi:hypothetical protein